MDPFAPVVDDLVSSPPAQNLASDLMVFERAFGSDAGPTDDPAATTFAALASEAPPTVDGGLSTAAAAFAGPADDGSGVALAAAMEDLTGSASPPTDTPGLDAAAAAFASEPGARSALETAARDLG